MVHDCNAIWYAVLRTDSYYRARYYDSQIGRFISEDPFGFAAGVNHYAYAHGNPIIFSDMFGLEPGYRPDKGDLLRRLTCSKNCSELFGGLPNALHALAATKYIDIDPKVNEIPLDPAVENLLTHPNYMAVSQVDSRALSHAPNSVASWVNTYYSGKDARLSATLFLHELRHGVGYYHEIDQDYDTEYFIIFLNCPQADVPTVLSTLPYSIDQ